MMTGVTYDSDYKPTPPRVKIPVEIIQELRLGSYVLYGDELTKVDYNFFAAYYYRELERKELFSDSVETPYLNGIPITEELLLSIGFEKQRNYDWNGKKEVEIEPYYFHRSQIRLSEFLSPPGIYRRKNNTFHILGGSYPELKYLHQYQNWFLIKTGEEMIIDEEILKNYIEKNEDKIN